MLSVRINVAYGYGIHFTRGVFSQGNNVLKNIIISREGKRRHGIIFFVEEKIAALYPGISDEIADYFGAQENISLVSRPVVMSGGEDGKNFKLIGKLCGILADSHLCRQSFICIVGGGAFLDAVGFAASIVHRGIRQIRIPTTVLAQNDSGVGVKNGINMFGMKNFAGAFAPPFAVVDDFNFLDTLEQRDWISGVAEAFKVAMIKDAKFFRWLCRSADKFKARDRTVMEKMVKRCAELHVRHIENSGDPFEFGSARPLDFGHWSAHKLEMMSGGGIRHGEAVAIGLALDSFYAVEKGLLRKEDFDLLTGSLKKIGFRLWSDLLLKKGRSGRPEIFSGIREFREHLGGELHVTLPNGLGGKIEVNELDEEIILKAIRCLETE
ncbi:MAG: 3-dehydroquinate synthase [Victivallales bacterium]